MAPQRTCIGGKHSQRSRQIGVFCVVEIVKTAYFIKAGVFASVFFAHGGIQSRFYSAHLCFGVALFQHVLNFFHGITCIYQLPLYKPDTIVFIVTIFAQRTQFFVRYEFLLMKKFPKAFSFLYYFGIESERARFIGVVKGFYQNTIVKAVVLYVALRYDMIYLVMSVFQFVQRNGFFRVHAPAQLQQPQKERVACKMFVLVRLLQGFRRFTVKVLAVFYRFIQFFQLLDAGVFFLFGRVLVRVFQKYSFGRFPCGIRYFFQDTNGIAHGLFHDGRAMHFFHKRAHIGFAFRLRSKRFQEAQGFVETQFLKITIAFVQ